MTTPTATTGRAGLVRVGACLAAAVAGTFAVGGCLVALRLEAVGLGRPRDSGMRADYVGLLIAGVVAGVAIPTLLSAWLLPRGRLVTVASLAAVVGAAGLLVAVLGFR